MCFIEAFFISGAASRANKLRALRTMLSILIGIATLSPLIRRQES